MNPERHRHGFTLVELLVVLAILTALSAIAVQSLDGVQDQSRYQSTQQSMQNIEDSVLGPATQLTPDGTISVTGFVADTGRLPVALNVTVTQPDGSTATFLEPQELWANPNGIVPFSLRHAWNADSGEVALSDQDTNVYVPCGWRGPYLRLGAGQTDLRDGWGNPYDLLRVDRSPCVLADFVSVVRSNGANGTTDNLPTTGYNPDLFDNFSTNSFDGTTGTINFPAVSASDRVHATMGGNILAVDASTSTLVNPPTGNGSIYVRFFAPNPNGNGILVLTVPDSSMVGVPNPPPNSNQLVFTKTVVNGPTLSVTIDTATNSGATPPATIASYAVTNATIGPRTIRAYQGTLPAPGVATPAPNSKSASTTVMLTAGGLSKDLILR